MNKLKTYQNRINEQLKTLNFPAEPANLYAPIRYAVEAGGKRLRPALCLLACDLFGEDPDKALGPAIGIEIFHNFTLVHDDIMDNAPVRRNLETVYRKYGTNSAILSGDTMMAMAYGYLMQAPGHCLTDILTIFNRTAIEVCEGQQMDMDFENLPEVSEAQYLEMIRLKTAVLLAASLEVGARIGRAGEDQAASVYRFGEAIGMAFQLQDDLLDAFGSEEVFGKKPGGDIRANKKTILFLKAREMAGDTDKNRLDFLFSNTGLTDEEKVNETLAIFRRYRVNEIIDDIIEQYYNTAFYHLEQLNLSPEKSEELSSFALSLKNRKS
ncbi:MAG: polyprenyl synthetase family protein [Bacteroidales bacterium]